MGVSVDPFDDTETAFEKQQVAKTGIWLQPGCVENGVFQEITIISPAWPFRQVKRPIAAKRPRMMGGKSNPQDCDDLCPNLIRPANPMVEGQQWW